MRVLLCTCAKNENNYILEWVEHNKKLGFDNIVIYDNNDIDGERFDDILKEYIESGYVIIKDVRGKECIQIPSFDDCYQTLAKDYDWVCFIDIDEFIEIDNNLTIKEFISQPKFKSFNSICLCWKLFDDNNLIEVKDNNYSIKRFTHFTNKNSNQVKRIVKTNIDATVNSSHTFVDKDYLGNINKKVRDNVKSCNTLGKSTTNSVTIKNNTWEDARINHYRFKTLEEYITNKAPKGYATAWKNKGKDYLTLNTFFKFNTKTKEKIKWLKDKGII